MKHLLIVATLLSLFAIWYTYQTQKQNYGLALGASILSTASSDTIETFRTNVNTSLTNLNVALSSVVSTSTVIGNSQVVYGSTLGLTSVATSTATLGSGFSYTGIWGNFVSGSSGTLKQVLNHSYHLIATSTGGTLSGTTTVPIEVGYGEVWNNARCFTNIGTVNVQFGYGTASTSMFNASTTIGTVTFTSNNTMTSGEKVIMAVGTPASSVGKVVCTINSTL